MPPLELLPDRFDFHTHEVLDKLVNESMDQTMVSLALFDRKLEPPELYISLLREITLHSNGKLKYDPAVLKNVELQEMLSAAWEIKSYNKIRRLAILSGPSKHHSKLSSYVLQDPSELYRGLSESFKAEYHGAALEGFYEYLTHNEYLFSKHLNLPYYAKYCSIVQSSGTGKSRLLTELYKRDIIVLYITLREVTDVRSFPLRDTIPADILTKFPSTQDKYHNICYAFFIALFRIVHEQLQQQLSTYPESQARENVLDWARQLCDVSHDSLSVARSEFFKKFLEEHAQILANVDATQDSSAKTGTSLDVEKVAGRIHTLSISESTNEPFLSSSLTTAYRNVGDSLRKIFPEKEKKPQLVIAIDEAHPLTPMRSAGQEQYRPADILCRIINQYTHEANYPIWVVFASTTAKVAVFSPPNQMHNSDRVANMGQLLFPPYTQLGWDQGAPWPEDVDPEDVSKADHIAGYGRPLWRSLKTALGSPNRVWEIASAKLLNGNVFRPCETGHVLAVLGQRFGLNVSFGHPDAVTYLEDGVASHLRICLATTLDRHWRFTEYPSEPFLSCVAARVLHSEPQILGMALGTLLNRINAGMIDMGQRGELASQLLWLLAKDLFVRRSIEDEVLIEEAEEEREGDASAEEQEEVSDAAEDENSVMEEEPEFQVQEQTHFGVPSSWDDHMADCKMIRVVDWLEFVFGKKVWDERDPQTALGRELFDDAYLNFSHWVSMDSKIAGETGSELPLDEWTLRHWHRTSAVQCCHPQPLIDKVIPIYFKGGPETAPAKSRMSQIFISDKARASMRSNTALHDITRRNEYISGDSDDASDCNAHPYIAILVDLAQPYDFAVTFPLRDTADRCLRIYAAGIDGRTYPFLRMHRELQQNLDNLIHPEKMFPFDRPYADHLNALVKFGRSSMPDHMHWERGRVFSVVDATVKKNKGVKSRKKSVVTKKKRK